MVSWHHIGLKNKGIFLNVNLIQGLWVKTRNSAFPLGVRPTEMRPLASRLLRLREILTLLISESALTSSRLPGEALPRVRIYSDSNHASMRR